MEESFRSQCHLPMTMSRFSWDLPSLGTRDAPPSRANQDAGPPSRPAPGCVQSSTGSLPGAPRQILRKPGGAYF